MLKFIICLLTGLCSVETGRESPPKFVHGIMCTTPETIIAFANYNNRNAGTLQDNLTKFNTVEYPEGPCVIITNGELEEYEIFAFEASTLIRVKFKKIGRCKAGGACKQTVFYSIIP